MAITGGCHCGSIRYVAEGKAINHALCHCTDCRRSAGAPMVGWTMYPDCGSDGNQGSRPRSTNRPRTAGGISAPSAAPAWSITNEVTLPGLIDVQSATYDNPDAVPAQAHIQVAERIGWMERAHELPSFERFPSSSST
jgi:hypothetical protein